MYSFFTSLTLKVISYSRSLQRVYLGGNMMSVMKQLSRAALLAGVIFMTTGDASAQQPAASGVRKTPTEARFFVGAAPKQAGSVVKNGPTIVPVVDSNAILNLDYNEMRSTPKAVAKPAPIEQNVVAKEPTLAELKLQLRTAEDELKAAKLEHTQAVRSKDKTRVEVATRNRDAAKQKVAELKKVVAAKEPAKASKRKAVKKRTPGAAAKASNSQTK
jgi:hypothetical protein